MWRTLQARLTLVTTSVALIAVMVTGAFTVQFVRSTSVADARAQLSAAADLLAGLPAAARLSDLPARVRTALGDIDAGLVTPDGTPSGSADLLAPRMITRLASGMPVSATVSAGGTLMLIEARPTNAGGAVVLARARSSIDGAADGIIRRLLLAFAVGLGVAVIGGALFARGLTRPLARVATAARRMAAGERGVAPPTSVSHSSELGDVTTALATLDEALATSEGRQREFLLSISHELRTPLTALRGYAEALCDGMIALDGIDEVGRTLVAETDRLDRFLADLLELARLEGDDFSVQRALVDVGDVARAAKQAWLGRATVAGVEVRVEARPAGEGAARASASLLVQTDRQRVRQLIDGLIENALRVAPTGTAVTVAVRADARAIAIDVTDEGPGLSDDDLRVALQRGALRDRHRDSRPVGTGLGLSIAARLATRLGGTISAGRNPAGAGTRFTVTLPRDSADGAKPI